MSHVSTPVPGLPDSLLVTHPEAAADWAHDKNTDGPEFVRASLNRRVTWRCKRGHEWKDTIKQRALLNRTCPRCAKLDIADPEIAAQWHPTKNPGLSPSSYRPGSDKRVWWLCDQGHEWQATILSRTRTTRTCSECRGTKTTPRNSLAVTHPALAAQWHPSLNGKLRPDERKSGSQQKAWWLCDCGMAWRARIAARADGQGCPACTGRVATPTNCLAHVAPEVAAEWHPSKNGDLTPSDVKARSSRLVWWRCPKSEEHEWEAKVTERAGSRRRGCPFCGGQRVAPSESLAAIHPELAEQWVGSDRGVGPGDVRPGSNIRATWRCERGHEWTTSMKKRTSGQGCPYCAGKRTTMETSLAHLYPAIAAEWHPSKNGRATPDQITPGSNKKRWWTCDNGHAWHAVVHSRVQDNGCPYCARKLVTPETSLAAENPELASQWHPTKNGDVTPSDVFANARAKRWWLCDNGHDWDAPVFIRHRGIGCRFCAGQEATPETSLAAERPDVAAEWHPTLNGDRSPDQFRPASSEDAWWQCPRNPEHAWSARIAHRTLSGSGCPRCKLLPHSHQQFSLAHEIKVFIDFDLEDHKIRVKGQIWDVDIVLRDQQIAIEFDGFYWHRDKQDLDRKKADELRAQGWRVIRVRESPLEALHPDDVEVPAQDGKLAANATLRQVEVLLGEPISGLDEYLNHRALLNDEEARAYGEAYLARKETRRRERRERRRRGRPTVERGQLQLPGLDPLVVNES